MSDMSEGIVRVHLENPESINVIRTEEHEPEHMVFSTVVVAVGVAGLNQFEQVLPEDPLRKDWWILAVDAPAVLCSKAQVNDKANQVANVPFPQGGYLPQGVALPGHGTAQAFVTATTAMPNRVAVFVNRRGEA